MLSCQVREQQAVLLLHKQRLMWAAPGRGQDLGQGDSPITGSFPRGIWLIAGRCQHSGSQENECFCSKTMDSEETAGVGVICLADDVSTTGNNRYLLQIGQLPSGDDPGIGGNKSTNCRGKTERSLAGNGWDQVALVTSFGESLRQGGMS